MSSCVGVISEWENALNYKLQTNFNVNRNLMWVRFSNNIHCHALFAMKTVTYNIKKGKDHMSVSLVSQINRKKIVFGSFDSSCYSNLSLSIFYKCNAIIWRLLENFGAPWKFLAPLDFILVPLFSLFWHPNFLAL